MKKTLKYQWKCTTNSGITKEVDSKFDLDWEKKGVKKFELKEVDGDSVYGVNFVKGEFNLNGKKQLEPNAKGSNLKFFRRNVVIMDTKGNPLSAKVKYFVGYLKNGKGKAIKIEPDGSVEIVNL